MRKRPDASVTACLPGCPSTVTCAPLRGRKAPSICTVPLTEPCCACADGAANAMRVATASPSAISGRPRQPRGPAGRTWSSGARVGGWDWDRLMGILRQERERTLREHRHGADRTNAQVHTVQRASTQRVPLRRPNSILTPTVGVALILLCATQAASRALALGLSGAPLGCDVARESCPRAATSRQPARPRPRRMPAARGAAIRAVS